MNIPGIEAVAGGTLLIGLVAACWGKLKAISWRIASLLVVRIQLEEDASIDEALGVPDGRGSSTRPGRVDRAVELKELDAACRRRLAERILEHCPDEIQRLVIEGEGDTGAQFQDRCAQVALARYWAKQPPK